MQNSTYKADIERHLNSRTHHPATETSVEALEREANNFSRTNRSTPMANLYIEGMRKGCTPEQAFAQALEANPEAYQQFRARHNAKALIKQLQDAGVTLQMA